VLLKQSHGMTIALRKLEVGPAYAVWTGAGAAGTAVVGMAVLGESVSVLKLVSIRLILAGAFRSWRARSAAQASSERSLVSMTLGTAASRLAAPSAARSSASWSHRARGRR
jgi:hypothetical protein